MSDNELTTRFYVRPAGTDTKALEDALVQWINEVRAGRGLPPLRKSESDDKTDGGETNGK